MINLGQLEPTYKNETELTCPSQRTNTNAVDLRNGGGS